MVSFWRGWGMEENFQFGFGLCHETQNILLLLYYGISLSLHSVIKYLNYLYFIVSVKVRYF